MNDYSTKILKYLNKHSSPNTPIDLYETNIVAEKEYLEEAIHFLLDKDLIKINLESNSNYHMPLKACYFSTIHGKYFFKKFFLEWLKDILHGIIFPIIVAILTALITTLITLLFFS